MFAQATPQMPQITEAFMIWALVYGALFTLVFWGLIIWGAVKLLSGRGKSAELEKEVAYLKGRLDRRELRTPEDRSGGTSP